MKEKTISTERLEQYVLGMLSVEETRAVEAGRISDPEVEVRLALLEDAVERLSVATARTPPEGSLQSILEMVEMDLLKERMSGRPPVLHEGSTPSDFVSWTERSDMIVPEEAEVFHLVPLDESQDRETGLVWIKNGYPEEVHADCVERILIIEGSCEVHIGEQMHSMAAGDVLTIPMHIPHHVVVTGKGWCKAVVQRVAA